MTYYHTHCGLTLYVFIAAVSVASSIVSTADVGRFQRQFPVTAANRKVPSPRGDLTTTRRNNNKFNYVMPAVDGERKVRIGISSFDTHHACFT